MESERDESTEMPAGAVARAWRYPVKSMRGRPAERLEITASGVTGDRRFAIRHGSGKLASGKTTASFHKIDGLLGFEARYDADERPWITLPDGRRLRGDAPDVDARLSDALGQPVALEREDDGSHLDAGPLHLLTTASLRWLAATLPDARTDERRFRPNLVLDVAGDTPVETGWVGRRLRLGDELELRVTEATVRCGMVALAQSELPHDPRVLRHITREAGLEFGVYAEVIAPGRVRPGDAVVLLTGAEG